MASGARVILDPTAVEAALSRIAEAIASSSADDRALALIGIRTRGVPLATRLQDRLAAAMGRRLPLGMLDITLYRDDFTTVGSQPILQSTEIEFPITGSNVILVDDVLYTGRTVRAALDGLIDFGRPRRIQLAVLIDRGHRELPITADFIGETVQTRPDEFVRVRLNETDGEDAVIIGEIPSERRSDGGP